jgi:hypothetical protein
VNLKEEGTMNQASNIDLLGLLVDALTGTRESAGVLVDAIKEAGREEAAQKLEKLLGLHNEVLDCLEERRLLRDQLADFDDVEAEQARLAEVGAITAYENVLALMGEEIPPEPEPNAGCDWCGMTDRTGQDGLCDQCRASADEVCQRGYC